MTKIVVGSRESRLAVVQTEEVIRYLRLAHPEIEVSMLTMKTTGDRILDRRLDQIGGKGLFVKELDRALAEKRTDLSVHSLKDLPMELPEGYPVICYSKREDPRDVLVLPRKIQTEEGKASGTAGRNPLKFRELASVLDPEKPVGSSSLRRVIQLKMLRPDLKVESVRGNVQTRLRKLDEGQYSALIMAAAGLKRLGLEDRISCYFTTEEMIPSAGQGILAVQGRADFPAELFRKGISPELLPDHVPADAESADAAPEQWRKGFADNHAAAEAVCERAFVRYLNGGCSAPIAAHAECGEDEITVRGFYFDEDTKTAVIGSLSGEPADAEKLGERLADKLKNGDGEKTDCSDFEIWKTA